jgi:hypothetical protein
VLENQRVEMGKIGGYRVGCMKEERRILPQSFNESLGRVRLRRESRREKRKSKKYIAKERG